MKLKELYIENVQSIKKLTLKFPSPNGVYRIAGQNSAGKSAIRRSLELLYFNDYRRDTKDLLRTGESMITVRATGWCGHKITLKRGKHTSYLIEYPDGTTKEYPQVGEVPEEVTRILGAYIDPLSSQRCNIRSKDDPLFLVSTADKDTYTIIQTATKSEQIKEAIDRGNTLINKLNREIDSVEYQIAAKTSLLDSLVYRDPKEFESIEETFSEYSQLYETTSRLVDNISKLSKLEDSLSELTGQLLDDTAIEDALTKLEVVKILNRLKTNQSRLDQVNQQLQTIEQTQVPEEELDKLSNNIAAYKITSRLIQSTNRLTSLSEQVNMLTEKLKYISNEPDLVGLKTVSSIIKNSQGLSELREKRKQLRSELKQLEQQELDTLIEMKVCPTCGNIITGEGHRH